MSDRWWFVHVIDWRGWGPRRWVEGIELEEIPFDRVRIVDVANRLDRNYVLDVDRREYKKKWNRARSRNLSSGIRERINSKRFSSRSELNWKLMEIIEEKFDISSLLSIQFVLFYIEIYILKRERLRIVNNCSCKN